MAFGFYSRLRNLHRCNAGLNFILFARFAAGCSHWLFSPDLVCLRYAPTSTLVSMALREYGARPCGMALVLSSSSCLRGTVQVDNMT
jgi:hypothetical protein